MCPRSLIAAAHPLTHPLSWFLSVPVDARESISPLLSHSLACSLPLIHESKQESTCVSAIMQVLSVTSAVCCVVFLTATSCCTSCCRRLLFAFCLFLLRGSCRRLAMQARGERARERGMGVECDVTVNIRTASPHFSLTLTASSSRV